MADDQNLDQNPEGAVEAEVPAWVPEKFKDNPEQFGVSYTNLERELNTRAQREKELQTQIAQYETMLAQQPEPAQQNNDQLYQAYENDPVATMAWLAQQAAEQAVKGLQPQLQQQQQPIVQAQNELLAYTVDQMVSQRIPDWGAQKQKVADFVSARPYLLPETALTSPATTADALESAYKAMRYDELQNQSQTQAEQLAQANELAKLQAQTLTGSPGRPGPTDADKEYWESVKNVPTNKFALG